jgi:hypothetical protein
MNLGRPEDMPPAKTRLRQLVEDENLSISEATTKMAEEGYEGHHIWGVAVDDLYPDYRNES